MRFLFLFCLAIGLATFAMGCQQKKKKGGAAVMRVCFDKDPLTIDPRKNGDIYSSTLQFMIYEGLVRLLPNGEIEPALAESIDISPDQLTYTFHLRDAFWSDGTPITAHDFVASWKKILSPHFPSPCPQLFYPIKNGEAAMKGERSQEEIGITALDEKTLKVELEHPTPYFLSLITFCNFYPIPLHVEKKNPRWDSASPKEMAFSGPFKLVQWDKNKQFIVEKNERYWNKKDVKLDRIEVYILHDPNTTIQMFENGELDWVSQHLSSLPLDIISKYYKEGKTAIASVGGTAYCTFNTNRFPFTNANIRKAFSYALDRAKITVNITQTGEIPASRYLPPAVMHNQNRTLFPLCDVAAAKTLFKKGLQELGYSGDNPAQFLGELTLLYDEKEVFKKLAIAMQQDWEKAFGIRVHLQCVDFKTLVDLLSRRDYHCGLNYWIVQYNDPMNVFERFKYQRYPRNYPGFENREFIDLVDRSFQAKDPFQRVELLEKAEAVMMNEAPLAPLYHINYLTISKPYVRGVEISPIGAVQFRRSQIVQ